MQGRLTLRMDDRVIAEAKAWARARGVSLSEVVGAYLASLSEPPRRELAPWTRRLAGIARGAEGEAPTDEQVRAEYAGHVEAKHR